MKILFINRVLGLWRGGGETFDIGIARELAKLDCNVEFATGCYKDGIVTTPLDEFKTSYIYSPYLDPIVRKVPFKFNGIGKLWILDKVLWGQKVFKSLLHKSNYDGIFINGIPTLGNRIVTELFIPTIVMFHGPPDRLLWRSIRNGKFIPASVGDAFLKIKKINDKALHLNLGITSNDTSLTEVEKGTIRNQLRIPENSKIVLYVGRLEKIKNIPMLIKSFQVLLKDFQNCSLLVVGDGPERQKLIKMAQELNISHKVYFTGWVSHNAINDYYQIADALAICSDYDNYPTVVLEAMLHKLPIIATKVGGIPLQIKNDENGFLVERGDSRAFTECLKKVLKNDYIKTRIGLINHDTVISKYSWKETATKIFNTYRGWQLDKR